MDDLMDVPGVNIGHWTDPGAQTGCTVLRFDHLASTACDVRGAAPGSRELALLAPGRALQRADAILFTGGSAFGLAAAEGVMQWLKENGRGYPTPAGPVPIVPSAVIYDLATGDAVAPAAANGYDATNHATPLHRTAVGRVGAGTGARFGAIAGTEGVLPGGLAISQVRVPDGVITAVVVLNAFGELCTAGSTDAREALVQQTMQPPLGESTTLMACISDLPLDHDALLGQTVAMHDALARCIRPAHTIADGDIAFAVAVKDGASTSPALRLQASIAAELAVEAAIEKIGRMDFATLHKTGAG